MSRLLSVLLDRGPRRVPRRCRANAWASVYGEVYDVDPVTDGGDPTDD